MTTKHAKFGFARRAAYDLSQQHTTSLTSTHPVRKEAGRSVAGESSYNSQPPTKAVLKRLKLR